MGGKGGHNKRKENKNKGQQYIQEHSINVNKSKTEEAQVQQQIDKDTQQVQSIKPLQQQQTQVQQSSIETTDHDKQHSSNDSNTLRDRISFNPVRQETVVPIKESQTNQKLRQVRGSDNSLSAEQSKLNEEASASEQTFNVQTQTHYQDYSQDVVEKSFDQIKNESQNEPRPMEKGSKFVDEYSDDKDQQFEKQAECIQRKNNQSSMQQEIPSTEVIVQVSRSHEANPVEKQPMNHHENHLNQDLNVENKKQLIEEETETQQTVNQENYSQIPVKLEQDVNQSQQKEILRHHIQDRPETVQSLTVVRSTCLPLEPQQVEANRVQEVRVEEIPTSSVDNNQTFEMQQSLKFEYLQHEGGKVDSNEVEKIILREPHMSGEPEIHVGLLSQTKQVAKDQNIQNRESQKKQQEKKQQQEQIKPFITVEVSNTSSNKRAKPWETKRNEEQSKSSLIEPKVEVEETHEKEIAERQAQESMKKRERAEKLKQKESKIREELEKNNRLKLQIEQQTPFAKKMGISLTLTAVVSGVFWIGTNNKKNTAIAALCSLAGSFILQK